MKQSTTTILTKQESARFQRDGYLVIDPEISPQVIDGVLSDLSSRYVSEGETRFEAGVVYQPGPPPRIKDAWRISDNVLEIALAPKVLGVLQELFSCTMLPFQTLNFPVGTQQAAHSDAMHFRPSEPTLMCGVWVALENIDMSNGPLIYYPGSQSLPFLNYRDVHFRANKDDYRTYMEFIHERNRHYEEHVRGLLQQHEFEPAYGTLRKGQALIWSSNLLHGGAPQEDNARTRHSQVTHYLHESSFAYHTPMRTEGDQEFWTEPEVIRSRDSESTRS
jgi:ectoine hydroxylase-related dioxygenase (phytanoyl-CoA dioxygenase family)